jgi:hypothetical protein
VNLGYRPSSLFGEEFLSAPIHSLLWSPNWSFRWLGHRANSVDLRGVGFNASVSDHEAQEQSGKHTEDTLCWVELPLEFS